MNYSRGSLWRKWDLHVHTPSSLVQQYGGDTPEAWDRFLNELEALPDEFKALGVNDYLFLDGYRRVRDAKRAGRLSNIDLILPVIELRLDKFGGTDGHLSRVNFHVIFSDEIEPEIIEGQFLNGLSRAYQLTPAYGVLAKTWKALPTRQSVTDLGTLIIDSVPADKRSQFGPPLLEGFNNLNVSLDAIHDLLQSHYFEGKFLTAVGKTEWWNIKWNDHSIAEKKTIINGSHLVFISAATIADCGRAREQLLAHQVNDRLLDCSDAHSYADGNTKDRLGKCFTWIKADTTFEGLVHAFEEYDQRVFLGDLPPKQKAVDSNRTRYIRSVSIAKRPGSTLADTWFDPTQMELNHDLVAVIGNKGSGKSALSDIIGLLGNTRNDDRFSFLCPQRFRTPNNDRSQHFSASLMWESGTTETRGLHEPTDHETTEAIKYIPQGLFDDICNEIPGGEETNFDRELKKVIFSHVSIADRLGMETLDELIAYKTEETHDAIEILVGQLHQINEEITRLEAEGEDEYRRWLSNAIQTKRKELAAHESAKPMPVPSPELEQSPAAAELATEIARAKAIKEELEEKLRFYRQQERDSALLVTVADKATQQIANFETQFGIFRTECEGELRRLGLNFADIVSLSIDTGPIQAVRVQQAGLQGMARDQIDSEVSGSVSALLSGTERQIGELQDQLDEPNRRYQAFLSELEMWEWRRDEIIGDEETSETLRYYEAQSEQLQTVPARLGDAEQRRLQVTRQIFAQIVRLAETYRTLYAPVQQFSDEHELARTQLQIKFDVSIVNVDFLDRFFDWIGRNVVGSFHGAVEGEKLLKTILARHEFSTEAGVLKFLADIMDHLRTDRRSPTPTPVRIGGQLRKGRDLLSLYDYLFSLGFLRPRYVLKLGDKELSQLSPGERGGLLLLFYLLIDKDTIPLVIDQPEENLDNQTVYELLVGAIREAKQRRQIIIVTHSPNLAVVCDAEQIICCSMDKLHGNRIEYFSGAIENPAIKKRIIDVLEGTKPAFDNRKLKYEPLGWRT